MSNQDPVGKYTIPCPYCTRNLPIDAKYCPWCGTSYGSETIRLLRSVVRDVLAEGIDERRVYDRVPKDFDVRYSSAEGEVSSNLSDIGLGGAFINADPPLATGACFNLRIQLPDGGKEIEVTSEVVWTRAKEGITAKGRAPAGMGIKFLNLSPQDKERIRRVLVQVKPGA